MTSPSSRLRSRASCGLIHAVVSQGTLVSGFGSSCSQPLLANRPSQTVGSGRKISSSPPCAPATDGAGCAAAGGGVTGCAIGAAAGAAAAAEAPVLVVDVRSPPAAAA